MKTVKEVKEIINNVKDLEDFHGFVQESHREDFREIIKRRLEHCSSQLEEHFNESYTTTSKQIVYWKDGHFSLPVYEGLMKALVQDDWDALIWEQILRQMFEENNRDKTLFYIATEELLVQQRF